MRLLLLAALLLLPLALTGAPRDCRAQGFCATSRCFSSGECGNRCLCGKAEPGGHGVCVLR